MANITSSFTYLLPTELYVAGISTNVTGSYTYNGPEDFDVWVSNSTGDVEKINTKTAAPSGSSVKTVNAKDSSQLPMAYALSHALSDNYSYSYTYTDETQSNGDVYKKIDNPDLRDAYTVYWDFANSKWAFKQILKKLENDSADIAIKRRDWVKSWGDKYDFGEPVNTKIDHYVAGIGTYLAANPYHKKWKFVTLPEPTGTIPKIPSEIQIEISKLQNSTGVV